MKIKKPILLIAWKRPKKVRQVINSIRSYKPDELYIFCDGFLKDNHADNKKILETRALIEREIDWVCNIKKKYLEINSGCKYAVSSAIDWFFSNVEEGIILEDDCVPNINFYSFCEKLLDRYRDKKEIYMIGGNNFQDGKKRGDGSYYFSIYSHIWGWASWRDRWELYDVEMKNINQFKINNKFKKIFKNKKELNYWWKIFNNLFYKNIPNTWDYQLFFTSIYYDKINIIPNVSLVENIGYGEDATHTTFSKELIKTRIIKDDLLNIVDFKHPSNIKIDHIADQYTFTNHYKKSFLKRMKLKIKTKLNSIFNN